MLFGSWHQVQNIFPECRGIVALSFNVPPPLSFFWSRGNFVFGCPFKHSLCPTNLGPSASLEDHESNLSLDFISFHFTSSITPNLYFTVVCHDTTPLPDNTTNWSTSTYHVGSKKNIVFSRDGVGPLSLHRFWSRRPLPQPWSTARQRCHSMREPDHWKTDRSVLSPR